MNEYHIRTSTGELKARVSAKVAGGIFNRIPGTWTEKDFVKGGKLTVFVIAEDSAMGDIGQFGVELLLWKDDYVIRKDK